MEKRTIIFIVASAALWILWFTFSPGPEQPVNTDSKTEEKVQENQLTGEKKDTQGTEKTKEVKSAKSDSNIVIAESKNKNITEKEFSLETQKYLFTFTNKGAAIKKAVFKERNIELTLNKKFYKAKNNFDFAIHFDRDEFIYGGKLENAMWTVEKETDSEVIYSIVIQHNDVPLGIKKRYLIDREKYKFDVEYTIFNLGKKSITFKDRSLIFSTSELIGPDLDFKNNYNRIAGAVYNKDGEFKKMGKGGGGIMSGCSSGEIAGNVKYDRGNISWAGIMGRYFSILMIPNGFSADEVITDNKDAHSGFRTGLVTRIDTIEPKQQTKKSFTVYLGEKDKEKLASVTEKIKSAADYSTLIEPIRNFVVWALNLLNRLTGNLGWALVIFSILTKLIFLPLTKKSTESMKRMQKLTPKMNEIKAKYKSDPKVMQQKMMELYRENKVNPMGGCFPMLLQMPFFFALYSALINSVDLWNAPFILWIKDLSMPDTVHPFFGLGLNILPLIMVVTTFLQQKLTTVDTTGQQQKMMMFMPLIMLFIFWSMPSGLVLYWTLQNTFQVVQQLLVNKFGKNKAESAA